MEGWSRPEAKQGQEAEGPGSHGSCSESLPQSLPNPPNLYPLTLALILPPVEFGDTRCSHAASRTLLGYGIIGISPRDHFRRKVRSTLRGLLLPTSVALKA